MHGATTMKGPGNRRKFPIFRTWQCARCGKRARTGVQVVHVACTCQPVAEGQFPAWLSLVEEPRPRPFPPSLPALQP
jgi:hypothetical protein